MTYCLLGTTLILLVLTFPLPSFAGPIASAVLDAEGQASRMQTTDFGSVSTLHPAPVSRTFTLHNSGTCLMMLTDLRSACGCTSAFTAHNAALPLVLLPGQETTIQVTLDPANIPPGPVSKLVWVYIQGQKSPATTLELKGVLVPPVRLSPAVLNYEHATAGTNPSQTLTMTWNPATLPPGAVPCLLSTNPDIQIRTQGTADAAPPATSGPQTHTYTCLLAPSARLGALDGAVQAVFTDTRSGTVVLGSVPLRGEVTGDIAAAPSVLAFGSAPSGQSITRQTRLTLAKPQRLTALSSSPYITARLRPADAAAPALRPFPGSGPTATLPTATLPMPTAATGSAFLLDVTLSPITPPGPLEAELTITTATGQRLRVPVFAIVTPHQSKP